MLTAITGLSGFLQNVFFQSVKPDAHTQIDLEDRLQESEKAMRRITPQNLYNDLGSTRSRIARSAHAHSAQFRRHLGTR